MLCSDRKELVLVENELTCWGCLRNDQLIGYAFVALRSSDLRVSVEGVCCFDEELGFLPEARELCHDVIMTVLGQRRSEQF